MVRARASAIVAAIVTASVASSVAAAGTKMTLLYTAGNSFTESYVASDQGFFAKHGLDITLTEAQNGSVISAALEAGSAQIGAPTPTVLLQADEQGLDLVIIASANRNAIQPSTSETGIAVRNGSGIRSAADLVGKKIAVPGLGGTIDVMTKKWLQLRGADYRKVDFVEMQLPQMPDGLRAGLVDAVATVNPFLDRIIASKAGMDIGDFDEVTPPGTMAVVYAATRAWATAHRADVEAFRAALLDSKAYIEDPSHSDAVRASIAKFTHLPPEAAASIQILTNLDPIPRPEGMAFWIAATREQGLVKGNPDPAKLIAP